MHRILVGVVLASTAASLAAQVPLDRPPNLRGTWVPDPGVLQFNFIHRFYVSGPPDNSVINYPTFTFVQGLPARLGLGVNYATKSDVTTDASNEFEVFGRWQVLRGGAVRLTVTPAYNLTAESVDGEVDVDWTRGAITLVGVARAMSNAYDAGDARGALGGGAVWRINPYVALAGDYAALLSPLAGEDPAWSAGLLLGIPGSPHMLSLHVSNVDVNTIQGSSRRGPLAASITDKPLFGFEFTIPIHLKRFAPWFGGGGAGPERTGAAAATGAGAATAAATVRISQMAFRADTVRIAVGQSVQWVNDDPLAHTVTFRGGGGSPEIATGGSFQRTFDQPGTFIYYCTPHPFMGGVVIVG